MSSTLLCCFVAFELLSAGLTVVVNRFGGNHTGQVGSTLRISRTFGLKTFTLGFVFYGLVAAIANSMSFAEVILSDLRG
jgi:hypothetical protein